jgi:hypothetical protein
MVIESASTKRKRRHTWIRRSLRRHWSDYVIVFVFVVACVVALLLLMDVVETSVNKKEKVGQRSGGT